MALIMMVPCQPQSCLSSRNLSPLWSLAWTASRLDLLRQSKALHCFLLYPTREQQPSRMQPSRLSAHQSAQPTQASMMHVCSQRGPVCLTTIRSCPLQCPLTKGEPKPPLAMLAPVPCRERRLEETLSGLRTMQHKTARLAPQLLVTHSAMKGQTNSKTTGPEGQAHQPNGQVLPLMLSATQTMWKLTETASAFLSLLRLISSSRSTPSSLLKACFPVHLHMVVASK